VAASPTPGQALAGDASSVAVCRIFIPDLRRATYRSARAAIFSIRPAGTEIDMRAMIGVAFAVLLLAATPRPAAADYGEDLCKKYLPPGTPCECVGDILDDEFDEEELAPLLQFLRAFMDGLKGDEAAAQKTIDTIAAKHGKSTIEDWLKRFEALSAQTEKTCKFKF